MKIGYALVSRIDQRLELQTDALKSVGVEQGGDKPFHTGINAENFHALEASTFTRRGKINAIYIDPRYNSRASDWKHNNDYVEKGDLYRNSKSLAMMEQRLLVARELLNPAFEWRISSPKSAIDAMSNRE